MRAKPILTLSLLAVGDGPPGHERGTRPRQADGQLRRSGSRCRRRSSSRRRPRKSSTRSRRASPMPSLYRQNNLAYPGALSAARVTRRARRERQAVSSGSRRSTPVSEPFLDLLVEINWASGRVVRDYTFLLDPPGSTMMAAPAEPVAPARTGAAPARAAPAAPHCRGRDHAAGRRRRHVHGQARRHAVEDRERISAAERDARPDAGRAVPEPTPTRSTART